MKKIILLALLVGLVGCQRTENTTKEVVSSTLKDPDSAEFRNVKGYCGEVNAKNSFGGYVGFKRFYVSNGVTSFYDEEDPLRFELGWMAHCERESQLSQTEKDECVALGAFAAAVIDSKQAGVSYTTTSNSITANSNASKKAYMTVIDDGYKNYNDQNQFAIKILLDCMSGKIKVPRD
ncbi:hypothetical protein KTJ54_15365 [Acinetobacter radioresistens]|uniref:hypothetical protein n=1 Tax=Acinetobacter radioresistens TaxID=40216 RepID=UPI0021D1AFCC|nr:hypothetical protein [Acinetobacter radioresistens]MCU4623464.1 hypothetical protein [Acinetobacter radioresistens]